MTSREAFRRRVALVAAAGLVPFAAGCGSGGDAAPDEPSSPSASATASASVPLPPPTTAVEPADGPLLRTEGATIRGLKTYQVVTKAGVLQGYRDSRSSLIFSPGYTDKPSLDAFARQEIRVAKDPAALERVEDVVVGGKYNAFQLIDTSDPTEERHTFGVMFLNGSWIISIAFFDHGDPGPLDADERQQVTDRILASFEPTFN